jgi:hypothetical protein
MKHTLSRHRADPGAIATQDEIVLALNDPGVPDCGGAR